MLEMINLTGCKDISDESVSWLIGGSGSTLKVIKLNSCFNLTDSSLHSIAQGCVGKSVFNSI